MRNVVSTPLAAVDPCPQCGTVNEMATGPSEIDPGDVSICLRCGHARQFQADRTLGPVDVETLPEEYRTRIRRAQAACLFFSGRLAS